jgi:tRNA G18 (ribose-2'-O)-methylase SpoU
MKLEVVLCILVIGQSTTSHETKIPQGDDTMNKATAHRDIYHNDKTIYQKMLCEKAIEEVVGWITDPTSRLIWYGSEYTNSITDTKTANYVVTRMRKAGYTIEAVMMTQSQIMNLPNNKEPSTFVYLCKVGSLSNPPECNSKYTSHIKSGPFLLILERGV